MIFRSELHLLDGGGIKIEYIEAANAQDAKAKHLEYLDHDVHEWRIESESIEPSALPVRWRVNQPNVYGIYR